MALSVSTQVSPVGSKLVVETSAGATADNNVLGTAGVIYMIDVDNASNGAASYLKVYDNAAPVVGTTPPDLIVRVAAGVRRSLVVPEGMAYAAVSFACVTAGGTAGTTAPTAAVTVRMVCA